MIFKLLGSDVNSRYCLLSCFILAFLGTICLLSWLKNLLPVDGGKAFAVNGEKSKGKPRGAGIIFILVFAILSFLLLPVDSEAMIYLLMIVAAMLTGYLDDASSKPWGRLKKGLLDFIIAGVCAGTYINFNGSEFRILPDGGTIVLHPVLFAILAILLIFVAINVVNCTDGVDGLCGTVAMVSLLSFYVVFNSLGKKEFGILPDFASSLYDALIITFLLSLMGYLWFNASPSRLMMGDAGSRAIGVLVALLSLKCGMPLLFIPLCLVFIVDGGMGLVKIILIRTFHRPMLRKIRTPLHDHARKVKGWSDTQTVFRLAIIQVAVSVLTLCVLFL